MHNMSTCCAESKDNPDDTTQQTTSSQNIDASLLSSNLHDKDTTLNILGIQKDFPLRKY